MGDVKTCKRCRQEKVISHFGKRAENATSSVCKECINFRALELKYGISYNEIQKLRTEQRGRCFICGCLGFTFSKGLAVDHCHKTGKIRGLLCPKCNIGLGHFEDNKHRLLSALSYLEKHNAS